MTYMNVHFYVNAMNHLLILAYYHYSACSTSFLSNAAVLDSSRFYKNNMFIAVTHQN